MPPRFGPGGRARKLGGNLLKPLPAPAKRRLRGIEARFDHGRYERLVARTAKRRERESPPDGGLPVPPPLLRVRVSGRLVDREQWLATSAVDAQLIREMVARAGEPMEKMSTVLDFGCGCGRVARHWAGLKAPEIHGADISRSAVRWCRRNLPFMETVRSGASPPLPYRSGRFDFVYALSVLTHLPEQAGRDWLAEMRRVLRPGGLLLFTVHGERYRAELDAEAAAAFDVGKLAVKREPIEVAGSNAYAAFHPPSYVWQVLLRPLGLEVVEATYEGPVGMMTPLTAQDNYLVRKS